MTDIVWVGSGVFSVLCDEGPFSVAYKPSGLHSVPMTGSLLSAVSAYSDFTCGRFDGVSAECGLLYRLDRVTSGLLVFAKSAETLAKLRGSRIVKTYEASVSEWSGDGFPVPGFYGSERLLALRSRLDREGSVKFSSYFRPFGVNSAFQRPVFPEDTGHFRKVKFRGVPYETFIEKRGSSATCRITRGARHQIRATLSALRYPIDGDLAYGSEVRGDGESISLKCVGLDFELDGIAFRLRLDELAEAFSLKRMGRA